MIVGTPVQHILVAITMPTNAITKTSNSPPQEIMYYWVMKHLDPVLVGLIMMTLLR